MHMFAKSPDRPFISKKSLAICVSLLLSEVAWATVTQLGLPLMRLVQVRPDLLLCIPVLDRAPAWACPCLLRATRVRLCSQAVKDSGGS